MSAEQLAANFPAHRTHARTGEGDDLWVAAAANTPLLSRRTSRALFCIVMALLVAWEARALVIIGNGLSPWSDPYSEADALRSSQAYMDRGIATDFGLPDIVYGQRFPTTGWVTDLYRNPLPHGIYTRYPPLPNWIDAAMEHIFGFDHLWAWRLFPIAVGLGAIVLLFRSLRRAFGIDRAALIIAGAAAVHMTRSHMHGLHYEGYAQSLLLVEFAVLVGMFWRSGELRRRDLLVLALLGFVQGWLSFDYCFVVTFAAIPFWLMRRADRAQPSFRRLAVAVLLPGAAFTAAHLIHFAEVAAFYGSIHQAVADYTARAEYRMLGEGKPYGRQVADAFLTYADELWHDRHEHFGVWLRLATVLVVLLGLTQRVAIKLWRPRNVSLAWSGVRRYLPAFATSAVVTLLWLLVMPSMSVIHTHIIPRLFFLPYFICVLILVRCAERESPTSVHVKHS